jgi:hypothetical protein
MIEPVTRILDPDVQTQAFGPLGEPGSPVRIQHIAQRLVGCYEEMLDWAAALRNVEVPAHLAKAFDLAAELREFIEHTVAEIDRIPTLVAAMDSDDEPVTMHLALVLTADELSWQPSTTS